MATEVKIVEQLRTRSSRKAVTLVHLIMLCTCTMFIFFIAMRWHQCKEVMESTGMTLSEVATTDYKSSYTECEVRAIESYQNAFQMLVWLCAVLGGWVAWPIRIKRNRKILKLIDNKGKGSVL